MITAKQVKELRDRTGAGMLDCKKALQETNGDISKAIDYLREKGIAKAEKKSSRIAAEGLCNVLVEGNDSIILELNSETDFVSKNSKFTDFLEEMSKLILESNVDNTDDALKMNVDGKTLEVRLQELTATIGEKISLRRVKRVKKETNQTFGYYKHMGGKIVALSVLNGSDFSTAKDISMHVAAQKPKYLNSDEVDKETLEHEKRILTQQALQEGKPEHIVEKMVLGRIRKYLKDICLVDQPFVKNPDITVNQYLKEKNTSCEAFFRLEVGEGIEKKNEDFAEEVMNQVKSN